MAIVRELFTDRERAIVSDPFVLPPSGAHRDLVCAACGRPNYDTDFARCAGCRRVDTFGFKVKHLSWNGERTSHAPAKQYRRAPSSKPVLAPTTVRVLGNPNAQISKQITVPQITEEGQAVVASESNWLSRFKATRTLNTSVRYGYGASNSRSDSRVRNVLHDGSKWHGRIQGLTQ